MKRPHAERPYAENRPWDPESRFQLRVLAETHGLRGILAALAEDALAKAQQPGLPQTQQSSGVRTARALEAAIDTLPLTVR
jgi:hypothetical protein